MAIYKKVNGKTEKIAENSIIDHNQLANRDQYGAHSISAIRKLPEKLTALKEKDEALTTTDTQQQKAIEQNTTDIKACKTYIDQVAENAKKINVEEGTGSFTFTPYDGDAKVIKTGYEVDNMTITVKNDKYVVKGLDFSESSADTIFKDPIKAEDIDNYAKTTNIRLTSIEAEDTKQNTELKKHQDNIYDLQARTKGLGGYITANNFKTATPTQDELTEYALTQISNITSKEEIFNQTKVVNLYDNNV